MAERSSQEADLNLIRQYLDSRESDQKALTKLETATSRLSSEVTGLRGALSTYATKGDVAQLDATQIERLDVEAEKRLGDLVVLRRHIRTQTWVLFGISMVLLLVACGVGAFAVTSNHSALKAYKNDRYNACVQHNKQTVADANITRASFTPLLQKEKSEAHPDPVVLIVLHGLSTERPQLTLCVR